MPYAALPEKVLVVNDKENREIIPGTERGGVELLNLRYKPKYNMNIIGMTLSLEVPEIIDLINQYDHDE